MSEPESTGEAFKVFWLRVDLTWVDLIRCIIVDLVSLGSLVERGRFSSLSNSKLGESIYSTAVEVR